MAERQITAEKPTPIKPASVPKAQEKELARFTEFLVREISAAFRKDVLESMSPKAVDTFEDAEAVNFAAEYTKAVKGVRGKLAKRFGDAKIRSLIGKILKKVDKRNRSVLYGAVEKAIGLSTEELSATEGLRAKIDAYIEETTQWVIKLCDDTITEYTTRSLQAMALGQSLEEVMKQYDGMVEQRKNHAKFTARNQIANFNSMATKTRAQNLGITEGIWRIADRSERTRPSHRDRDGKKFKLDKGLYSEVDQKWLLPGVDFQCFPGSAKLDHSSACKKLYRRWYSGELTEIIMNDGAILSATPNHPILTTRGFKAAGLLDGSDHIVRAFDKRRDIIEFHGYDMKPTFEQIFSAFELLGVEHGISPSVPGEFHGDISDGDIHVIALDSLLMDSINPAIRQKVQELDLPRADEMAVFDTLTTPSDSRFGGVGLSSASGGLMRGLDLVRTRLIPHLTPLECFGLALGSWRDTRLEQALSDSSTTGIEYFSDSIFAFAVLVHGKDLLYRQLDSVGLASPLAGAHPHLAKLFTKEGGVNADLFRSDFNHLAVTYQIGRVVDKRRIDFSGHVYNLQTVSGDYITGATVVSNCRCDYELVIPEA